MVLECKPYVCCLIVLSTLIYCSLSLLGKNLEVIFFDLAAIFKCWNRKDVKNSNLTLPSTHFETRAFYADPKAKDWSRVQRSPVARLTRFESLFICIVIRVSQWAAFMNSLLGTNAELCNHISVFDFWFSVSCTPLLCLNAAGQQNLRTRFSDVLCKSSFESSRLHYLASFFLRGAYSLSDNDSDFDEIDCTFAALIRSAWPYFFEKLFHRQFCCSWSQTTSNDGSRFRTSSNVLLQDSASRLGDDLPVIPSDSSEDEDDPNGQLQKRNLFQSIQHTSHHSPSTSSLSIKSGTSSRAQYNSSKLNTKKKKPRNFNSSNNSIVPSTYSNQSDSSQQNSFAEITPSDFKRDELGKISALLRRKIAMKPKGTHYNTTMNDFGQPVTRPKSPPDFPSVTSSTTTNSVSSTPQVKGIPEFLSNSTSDSVEVVVYPKEPFSSTSTSVSHHGYDLPMIMI